MKRFLRDLSVGALILLLTNASAWAQLSTAQLSGRVTDQSSAVLPGATVTVTQTNTGFTRSDVTDGAGSYVLPNLPTGPYRLEVSLSGFRTSTSPPAGTTRSRAFSNSGSIRCLTTSMVKRA